MKFVIAGSRPGNPSIRKKFLLLPAHDCLALDSRLRGNEQSLLFTPFVPAKAGTQFFLDSRLRGNERSTSKAARDQNRGRFFHTSAKPVNLTLSNA